MDTISHREKFFTSSTIEIEKPTTKKTNRLFKKIPLLSTKRFDIWHDLYVLGMPASIVLAAFVMSIVISVTLPSPQGNISPSEFSESRAYVHLQNLTSYSRPLNVAENMIAKAYILEILNGIQDSFSISSINETKKMEISVLTYPVNWMGEEYALDGSVIPQYVVETHGIAVRVSNPDSDHSDSVLLTSNFDTTCLSRGAGDNGISVAAMLEVVSNIMFDKSALLKTDLIFLFSNGDNGFSAGIKSFMTSHEWSNSVSMFLAYWGGGMGGRAQMFKYYNANILAKYAKTIPRPWTNVLTSGFMTSGLLPQHSKVNKALFGNRPGLIFAHYENRVIAGTTNDNIDGIAAGSLQHLGDNMKELAKVYSNIQQIENWLASQAENGDNYVYFDVLGVFCIYLSDIVSLCVAVGIIFFVVVYSIFRIKARPGSLWNLQVGTVDIKILLTSFGLVVLTIVVSFLPVLFLSGIFELIPNQVSTHYVVQISTYSFWITSSMLIIHFLIQDKFPVVFRAGINRWSHHLHIACLLLWCMATIFVFPIMTSGIQVVSVWTLSTLLQLLFDHLIRFVTLKWNNKRQMLANSLTIPLMDPDVTTTHHHSISTNTYTSPKLKTKIKNRRKNNDSINTINTININNGNGSDNDNQEEIIDENLPEMKRDYSLKTIKTFVDYEDRSESEDEYFEPKKSVTIRSENQVQSKPDHLKPPKSIFGFLNPMPRIRRISGYKVFIHLLQFFKHILCIFGPSVLHWELCIKLVGSISSSPVVPLLWGLYSMLFIFPVLLIITPELQKIRHLKAVMIISILCSMGFFITPFLLTNFDSTQPNTVFLHHIQQDWFTPEKSYQTSFLYLQATDVDQVTQYADLDKLCEWSSNEGNKRCSIKFGTDGDLRLPAPTPWIQFVSIASGTPTSTVSPTSSSTSSSTASSSSTSSSTASSSSTSSSTASSSSTSSSTASSSCSPTVTSTSTSSPTSTPSSTTSSTETPSSTSSSTETPSSTSSSTETPTNTATSSNTNTPSSSETSSETSSSTSSETPTSTETPSSSSSETPSSTPTETPTSSSTESPSSTPTETPTSSSSETSSSTSTQTPTQTPTSTPTETPSSSSTETPTQTPTSSITPSSSETQTPTETPSSSPSNSQTQTPTETITSTLTPTSTLSISSSITESPTETVTSSITSSPTTTVPVLSDSSFSKTSPNHFFQYYSYPHPITKAMPLPPASKVVIYGVTVQPGVRMFAIDFRVSSNDTIKWYGPCYTLDNNPNTSCSLKDFNVTDGYPMILNSSAPVLFLYPANADNQRYYFQMNVSVPLTGPSLSLMSFYGYQEISHLVDEFLVDIEVTSWVTVKANFLGNAHLQGYWYVIDNN